MAAILGPMEKLVHDTAGALIDKKIPQKVSDSVTGLVSAGFGIVSDLLAIVQDLTKPEAAPAKPPQS